jgi:hypothetical protein
VSKENEAEAPTVLTHTFEVELQAYQVEMTARLRALCERHGVSAAPVHLGGAYLGWGIEILLAGGLTIEDVQEVVGQLAAVIAPIQDVGRKMQASGVAPDQIAATLLDLASHEAEAQGWIVTDGGKPPSGPKPS